MKKKLLRITAMLLCLTLTLMLVTGCGESKSKIPDPIPVPEGGWTKKELMSVTTIADNPVSCPPLYGEFKRNTEIWEDMVVEGDGFVNMVVLYDEEIFCDVTYRGVSKRDEVKDFTGIDEIYMKEHIGFAKKQISLNGLKFGDTKEKMIEQLGEPTKWITRSQSMAEYDFSDGGYMIIDLLMNKVYTVHIYGLTEKK